jgi:hypothetical protein
VSAVRVAVASFWLAGQSALPYPARGRTISGMSEATESVEAPTRIVRPRSRSRLWQFSLRELLLLTAIAGLSLTVWRLASGGFSPTPFLSNYRVREAIDAAQEELVGAATVGMTESVQVVGRAGSEEIGLKFVFLGRLREESPPPAALLIALQSRLKSQLADAGCEIVDEVVTPKVNSPRFPNLGFYINYRQGKTCGLVNVDAVARGHELEIYVLIHEFRER